jgi:hypothetical protein
MATSSSSGESETEVLFAGSAAHSLAGRSEKVKKFDGVEELNVLTFSRIVVPNISVAKVIAGNNACHYFLIGTNGKAYAFGRNEDGQVSRLSFLTFSHLTK